MELILTFETTNFAIKAERVLLQEHVDVRVMPLPSAIRAGCGLCLRLWPDEMKRATAVLAQNAVPVQAVYQKENGGFTPYNIGE